VSASSPPLALETWEIASAMRKQHRLDVGIAQDMLRQTGNIEPMCVLITPDGKRNAVVIPGIGQPESKDASYAALAQLAAKLRAVGLSLLTEAWMRFVKRRQGESKRAFEERISIPVREFEDRLEVLQVFTCWRGSEGDVRSLSTTREIRRDAKGDVIGFGDLDQNEIESTEARVAQCLPRLAP